MRARQARRAGIFLAMALVPACRAAAAGEVARLDAGARGLALGEACVAVAGDAAAVFWNPAGLGLVEGAEIALGHRWLAPGLALESGSAALRPGRARPLVLGLEGQILNRDGIAAGDVFSGTTGEPGAFEYRTTLHLALQPRAGLQVGAGAGRVVSTLDTGGPATRWSADAGLLLGGPAARLGLAVRDLGPDRRDDGSVHPARYVASAGFASVLPALRLLVAGQVDRARGGDAVLALGGEWRVAAPLGLRFGARRGVQGDSREESYSAGIGVESRGMRFDYAWRRERGGATQQALSLQVRLGATGVEPEVQEDAAPERGEPPVQNAVVVNVPLAEPAPAPSPERQPASHVEPVTPSAVQAAPTARPIAPETQGAPAGRFVVRAGVHSDMDAAALEIARLYGAELRPTLERHGAWYVVVVRRCATRAEAATWEARARGAGVRCSIDEE